jgi:hypothetical protein
MGNGVLAARDALPEDTEDWLRLIARHWSIEPGRGVNRESAEFIHRRLATKTRELAGPEPGRSGEQTEV